MATLKTVKHHHDFAHQLYGLVDVTQGITVLRMQQVRASVLQSRAYMEGVISVFREVRRSHRKEVEKLIAQKKKLPFLEEKKQGTVCILLTSSGKFSGLLTQKIIREFAAHVKNSDCDVVVVGMTGRELLPQFLRKNIQAQYFDFDLENPSRERLTELLTAVADYENVTVFTGKFQNLISQVPTAYNITGYEALRQENKESENSHEFLFEPSLHEIISFFVTQVTATLLRETLEESKLANLGSRVMALESSRNSITGEIGKLNKVVRRMKRRVDSRKQSNRLSSMRFWS